MTTTTRGNLALLAWIVSLFFVIGCVYWQLTHGLSLEEWFMMIGAMVIFVGSLIIYVQDKRRYSK